MPVCFICSMQKVHLVAAELGMFSQSKTVNEQSDLILTCLSPSERSFGPSSAEEWLK